jgi:hypothetical protein
VKFLVILVIGIAIAAILVRLLSRPSRRPRADTDSPSGAEITGMYSGGGGAEGSAHHPTHHSDAGSHSDGGSHSHGGMDGGGGGHH